MCFFFLGSRFDNRLERERNCSCGMEQLNIPLGAASSGGETDCLGRFWPGVDIYNADRCMGAEFWGETQEHPELVTKVREGIEKYLRSEDQRSPAVRAQVKADLKDIMLSERYLKRQVSEVLQRQRFPNLPFKLLHWQTADQAVGHGATQTAIGQGLPGSLVPSSADPQEAIPKAIQAAELEITQTVKLEVARVAGRAFKDISVRLDNIEERFAQNVLEHEKLYAEQNAAVRKERRAIYAGQRSLGEEVKSLSRLLVSNLHALRPGPRKEHEELKVEQEQTLVGLNHPASITKHKGDDAADGLRDAAKPIPIRDSFSGAPPGLIFFTAPAVMLLLLVSLFALSFTVWIHVHSPLWAPAILGLPKDVPMGSRDKPGNYAAGMTPYVAPGNDLSIAVKGCWDGTLGQADVSAFRATSIEPTGIGVETMGDCAEHEAALVPEAGIRALWKRGHFSYFEDSQEIEATVGYEVAQAADQVFEVYSAQSEIIEMQQAQNQLTNYSAFSSKLTRGICADSAWKGIGCGPEPTSCVGFCGGLELRLGSKFVPELTKITRA